MHRALKVAIAHGLCLTTFSTGLADAQEVRQKASSSEVSDWEKGMAIGSYFLRRWEVTRTKPMFRFCGPEATALMTPEFIAQWLRGEAEFIQVLPACPPRDSIPPWIWSPAFLPNADLVMILQRSSGPLTYEIDALAGLQQSGEGKSVRSRRERFEIDYQRSDIPETLRFSDFGPPLETTQSSLPSPYQFPPPPPGLTVSPELVLSQFLLRRWEVTGQSPTVRLCGSAALAMMAPAFRAYLTRTEQPLAREIVVDSTCTGPVFERGISPRSTNHLAIRSISVSAVFSSIEVSVPSRGEQFEWDHRRPWAWDQTLTFHSFNPVDD